MHEVTAARSRPHVGLPRARTNEAPSRALACRPRDPFCRACISRGRHRRWPPLEFSGTASSPWCHRKLEHHRKKPEKFSAVCRLVPQEFLNSMFSYYGNKSLSGMSARQSFRPTGLLMIVHVVDSSETISLSWHLQRRELQVRVAFGLSSAVPNTVRSSGQFRHSQLRARMQPCPMRPPG